MRRLLLAIAICGSTALGPSALPVCADDPALPELEDALDARARIDDATEDAPVVEPDDDAPFLVEFTNGDRLRGEALGVRNERLIWKFGFGSEIVLPLDALARIERNDGTAAWTPEVGNVDALFADPGNVAPSPAEQSPLPVPEAQVLPAPAEGPAPDPSAEETGQPGSQFAMLDPTIVFAAPKVVINKAVGLTERIELGGQFIDGNSESDSFNLNGEIAETTERRKHQVKFGGFVGGNKDVITANRWFVNGTFDFNRPKSARWLLFVTSRNEYDEFENLDYRGTLSAGVGYRLVNREDRQILFRLGPGVTGEFYRDPYREEVTPDIFAQAEITWPVFDRLVYEQDTTINPSVDDFEIFRLVSTNGLLLPLDEDETWNLKLGVRWEYNSQPNEDRLPSDYTTNLLLVYKRKK